MENKKKILCIVEAFGGGVFTVLSDLLNGISDDFNIVVAYSMRKQTPENFREYFNNNIKFIEVKNFTRSINIKKDFKALKEIKQIIKEEKPDIIHLHSSKAGVIGRLAVSGNKIKMFYNPHGFSFLKKDDSMLKRTIYWLIEKIVAMMNRKCTIVGCSKGEYEEAKKLNKNSILINNGINIKKLKQETNDLKVKEINFEDLKICTVGRIGYQKNPEMFNEIAKAFPNNKFTWIGDGELKNKLSNSNIQITGWKERKEVLQILNENDIFILTSLWEGLPISLLEAMYMKKLCIVNNCIGNRDVIINNENGFIANNVEEFVKYIQNILERKVDVSKLSSNANSDVLNEYNVELMIREYKKYYNK